MPLCRSSASLWKVGRMVLPESTLESRKYLAGLVVKTVRRRFLDLPAELLSVRLPAPEVALRELVVGTCTRNALGRARASKAADPVAWTVGRYTEIPTFGAQCLVDLLAAREEASADGWLRPRNGDSDGDDAGSVVGAPPLPIDLARLADISRFLERRLPLPQAELGRALVADGLASRPISPDELARWYEADGRPPPFRVVRRRGAEIVTAGPAQEIASSIISTAAAFISWWGLGNVQSVTERVGALKESRPDLGTARTVLGALPQLRWLDEAREWFSLRGESNRLTMVVRKVFSVVSRIARGELVSTLLKGQLPGQRPPERVVERYLVDIADCELRGDFVHAKPGDQAAALTPGERVLVDTLRSGGGELPLTELKRTVCGELPEWKVRHLVNSSPLFVRRDHGTVRLISPLVPAGAVAYAR
jgi:hypothetical protein